MVGCDRWRAFFPPELIDRRLPLLTALSTFGFLSPWYFRLSTSLLMAFTTTACLFTTLMPRGLLVAFSIFDFSSSWLSRWHL